MTKPLNIAFLRNKIRNFQRVISLQKQNLLLLESVTQKQKSLEDRIAMEFEYSSRIQKTLLFGSIPVAPGGLFTSARAQAAQGLNHTAELQLTLQIRVINRPRHHAGSRVCYPPDGTSSRIRIRIQPRRR